VTARYRWLVPMAAAFAVTLAACGISTDARPRDVAAGERLALAQPEAPAQAASNIGPKVYFLSAQNPTGQDRLQAVGRNVPATPQAVLNELLKGLTKEEQSRRLRTAIPADTQLIRPPVLQADGTLVVDLSRAFFVVTGEPQVKAVAQVVFSATGVEGVKRVQILVEGQPHGWPRGDGTTQPVGEPLTQAGYAQLNPTSQPDYPPIPSHTTSTASANRAPATTTTIATTPSTTIAKNS
jgi:Sporulation and spore germination